MEQLNQIGGRLLGKKSVAVILGLLGLCCPSSLWAEKLDTTFVLDMVIDNTPCYYTKYNDKGQIVEYDRHETWINIFNIPDFRFNTGYVTNERGDILDTLYYVCDRVTKQWKKAFIGSYSPSFHNNGMISSLGRTYYTNYTIYGEWNLPIDVTIPSESTDYYIDDNGYTREYIYTKYDAAGIHYVNIGEMTTRQSYDSLGNDVTDSNSYDDRGNLISSVQNNNHRYEHTYDSLDRRIKTIHYNATTLMDSTVYVYGHALHEGEPILLSLLYGVSPIDSFSFEQFHYDFSDRIIYDKLRFILPYGSTSEESYDAGTGILTLFVKGKDFAHDTTNANTYTFVLKKAESFITEMTFQDEPVEGFSPEKYVYDDFDGLYLSGINSRHLQFADENEEFSNLDYRISAGAIVNANLYDEQTGVLTITIAGADYDVNPTNTHTYTFMTKKINAYISSVRIAGDDFDGFSPDKYDYEMPLNYTWDDDFASSVIANLDNSVTPGFLSVDKSYDKSTHTLICYIYGYPGYTRCIYNTYRFHFQPCLTSINVEKDSTSLPLADFSPDKLEYELPDIYKDFPFNYIVEKGTIVKESFNDSTNTLTLSVFHSEDSSRVTEYHIHFIHPFISSLTINEEPLDIFSADTFDYWFDMEYNPDVVSYTLPDGVTATESFDDSTNVLSIRLATDNTSEMVEYKLHFRPVDGVDDFLGDHVSLYAMDRTICIDGATEPICVYDLLGTLAGTGRGEEVRIPVRQAGVYVVRAGRKAAKVVVK